jgi:hypothetical protein
MEVCELGDEHVAWVLIKLDNMTLDALRMRVMKRQVETIRYN